MAFVTPVIRNLGDGDWEIDVNGTDLATATEQVITLPFRKFRLVRIKARKSVGDATNIEALIGNTTAPTGNAIELLATAAPVIDENPAEPLRLLADGDNKIYYRPQPDAGVNNDIDTLLRIREGWVD